jgi:hypothetical protein
MPQALNRAPQQQRLQAPDVVHVLVSDEDVPNLVGRESARQDLTNDVHSVAGIKEDASTLGIVAPGEQEARLMPLGIRRAARA